MRIRPTRSLSGSFSRFVALSGLVLLTLTTLTARVSATITASGAGTPAGVARVTTYGELPLRFEANLGQADRDVRFLARGRGYTVFLTPTEAVLVLRAGTREPDPVSRNRGAEPGRPQNTVGRGTGERMIVRMALVGADGAAAFSADSPAGVANYFIGADPSRWLRGVPAYRRVHARSVYPGIDVVYYGRQHELEYDFVVAPGADPGAIRLAFDGVDRVRTDAAGDLLFGTAAGDVRLRQPVVYQDVDGVRRPIAAGYRIVESARADRGPRVGFRVAAYDTTRPLVIDPILSYSTFLGGGAADAAAAISVDASGAAYVVGYTDSTDFPQVIGPYGDQGGSDAFVTKLSPDGTSIVYSTYLGGGQNDAASAVAVDALGNVYVTGATDSIDFPTTAGAYQLDQGDTDAFVAKLASNGAALLYATYLGGTGIDVALGIAADTAGHAWVTGYTESADFPILNAFQTAQGGRDAFVTMLDTTKSGAASLVYSTYLGSSARDEGHGIAVDASGNAYVTGLTLSTTGFPVSANARQATSGGGMDAFVTKLNATGSGIIYSTYFGGSGDDSGAAIAIDTASIYIAGATDSTNLPLKAQAQGDQPGTDAFVAKFNPASTTASSSLLLSTYLGGSGTDSATGIAVNSDGAVFVTGITSSADFPGTGAIQPPGGGEDAFVTKLNAKLGGAQSVIYSTWLGGSGDDMGFGVAVDPRGNAYVVGATQSATGFPAAGAGTLTLHGTQDAFVVKLAEPDLFVTAFTVAPVTPGSQVTVTDTIKNQGDAPAGASTVKYFFSTDLTLSADDILLGSRVLPALATGEVSTATTTLTTATVPTPLTPGTYYVVAQVDPDNVVAEAIEGNNKFARSVLIGADLAVSALSFTQSGVSLSVTDTTINQGASAADATTTRFVLSTASTLGAGTETLLGSRAVGALAGGASDTATTALTIPSGVAAGNYFLIAQADSGGVVAESNETNNTRSKTVVIGADLTVPALTYTGAGGAGATVTVTDTTSNVGAVSAGASTTRFYLSVDSTVHAADPMLGARAIPALDPGATSTGSTDLVIPAGTVTGSYFIVAAADADGAVTEVNETNNTRSRSIKVGPDLAISFVNAPASANAGASISVSDTTKNIGGAAADASVTRYYLTTDGTVRSTDPVLLSRSIPTLAAGASSASTTSVTLPAATTPGSYVIVVVADADGVIAESTETNNSLSKAITVTAAPTPDLVVTALTVPAQVTAGPSISVSDTVTNQGNASAPASVTKFYLSADTTVHPSDPVLGSRSVPTLAASATSSGSTTLTLPANTTAGSYYIVAKADADGLITESDETNNTSAQPIAIAADLVVSALDAPASAGQGAAISVTDTTKNVGGSTAGASTTRYVLTTDGTIRPTDPVLLSRSVPSLASGAQSQVTSQVTVPAATTAGTYTLVAVADADSAVTESNETNNIASKAITVTTTPDLLVTALSVPATVTTGPTISVTDTTANQGAASAAASVTKFYLSADTTVHPTDPLLGSRSVPTLAASATSSGTTTLTLPANTTAGSYYVVAKADADGLIAESNDANNTAAQPIAIAADLVITAIDAPATVTPGTTIGLTDTTKNVGGSTAATSTTRYVLTTDGTIRPTDPVLLSRSIPSLASGAQSQATTQVTLPMATVPGSYVLVAVADADGAVTESNESNNTASKAITVAATPDLLVTALTVPPVATTGATVSVTDTTANQGTAASAASVTKFYLSVDTTVHPTDPLLGSRSVPTLAVGASSSGGATLTLPSSTAAGSYFIVAKADADGLITETDETNNTSAQPIALAPDLTITAISAPTSGTAGTTISVSDTTKNVGAAAAAASTTRYFLTTDGTIRPTDPVLLSRSVPSLALGAQSAATTTVTLPAATAPGPYVIVALADAGAVITEIDETNNTASAPITVLLPGRPDLRISAFTAPAAAGSSGSFSVSSTTTNQGTATAPTSVTRFYLSTDTTLDPSDVAIGSRSVVSLAPGASSTGNSTLTVPAGTVPGNYYVIAQADANGAIAESDETNNTAVSAIVLGSDLVITSFTVPASAAPGDAISVTDTTTNIGAGSTPTSTTRFYLSADGTFHSSDPVIGSRSVPILGAGLSSTKTTTLTVPGTAVAGNYFVVAVADADGVVSELRENNNVVAQPLRVTGIIGDGPISLVTQVASTGVAYDVVLAGGFAYVANDNSFTVFDLSVPTAPTMRGSVPVANGTGVAVRGNYAYMTSRTAGVVVIDISNPDAPAIVTTTPAAYAWAAAFKDNAMYVATTAGKLLVFSITDPTQPQLVKTIGLVAWRSPSLDATNLAALNSYTTTGGAKATDVTVVGNMLFTNDWAYGRLYYYDVSTATNPIFKGTHYAPYVLKVQADPARDVVYMLSAFSSTSGIYTVPISALGPDHSTYYNTCSACGYLKSTASLDQGGMNVIPGQHYFVFGGGTSSHEFHVVNRTDPNPAVMSNAGIVNVGPHNIPTEFTMGMKMSGDLVYVAAGALGLQVYQFPGLSAP